MPLRASHALSYKQTLAAILKFPITSFMPPLGRHLLLIETDLHLVRAGVMLRRRAYRWHARIRTARRRHGMRCRDIVGSNAQALVKSL